MRVLGVLDFPALLALKGRQITDGGKQRAAPDLRQVNNTPSLRRRRKGGGRGRVAVDRGLRFAHPRLYSVALSGLNYPLAVQAQSRHRGARSATASAMRDFVRSRSLRNLRIPILAVLRRSRLYAAYPPFHTFYRPNRQNENFSFGRSSPAFHTLLLFIALLSIWGVSLLSIVFCLFNHSK